SINTSKIRYLLYQYHESYHLLYNHPPPRHFYTLSLHDALPIWRRRDRPRRGHRRVGRAGQAGRDRAGDGRPRQQRSRRLGSTSEDRKSTRLNSSHVSISYADFCLKKKKIKQNACNAANRAHAQAASSLPNVRASPATAEKSILNRSSSTTLPAKPLPTHSAP